MSDQTYRAELYEAGGSTPFHVRARGSFDDRASESPPWAMISPVDEEGRPFRIEWAEIRVDGTPAWVEGTRAAGGTFDPVVKGRARCKTQAQYELAVRALDLLHVFSNTGGGRPKSGTWGQQAILEWYAEACDAFAEDDGRKPTIKDLCEALGVKSRTTARTRLTEAHLKWSPKGPVSF